MMGIKGAYVLAKSAKEKKQLADVITERDISNDSEKFQSLAEYRLGNDSILLRKLLCVKYHIHLDMAKQQKRYHKLVDEVFQHL
ncbi:AEL_collapsed_G0045860.mRNA.1.CDS.1 [Saccharomyces cerevisiae]|nr:AEL_collapsed_G0045860.mRNA.1.CDS.1 [Saccharomyces cerevisiae]